ncbi:unnamed protein product [Amoebophrya sp. A120]|nr:unnamed protein product [Amoebophrya sp. A120]|eukprot:GSA120T00017191001.1
MEKFAKKATNKMNKMVGLSRGEGKYFQTTKKGEIHEYKEELHLHDESKRMEAVKKVIAAMTVGKDMSPLFPDVVQSMQTTNVELKKLVYLYIINYARTQPELALLPVNSFCKDTQDLNALVRALAVRTMGCIRLDQIVEYLLEPLKRCCQDSDPYVRKTAAICIPKVYDINPDLVEDQGFVPTMLQDMLGDSNPMVVANAVAALSEISEAKGRDYLQLDRDGAVAKLLTALNECTEWGQIFILDALASYAPKNMKRDAEQIVDRVTARLSHANASVVMSAIKVVLTFMEHIDNQETLKTLMKKLTAPLMTLLSSESELQYVALRNIYLIAQKRPGIVTTDVKIFFVKYNDPVYVKLEKIKLMVMLCSDRNSDQVLQEFKDYAQSMDTEFAKRAVRSIGNVALKFESVSNKCIAVFLELIETKIPHVIQESVVVIKDIFRKYPSQYEAVLAALCDSFDLLDTTEAKSAMIWILGDYAERIDKVEDILDSFVEEFHDEPAPVQLQILTAVVKLFLKMPTQTQNMVTKVLKMATEESENPDLRDRGYIYWRLLHKNPEATKRVVLGDKPQIRSEMQAMDKQTLNALIPQLSFMSSVYHQLPEEFITRVQLNPRDDDDEDYDDENYGDKISRMKGELSKPAEFKEKVSGGDLLDLLDMDGDGGATPTGGQQTPSNVQKQQVLAATQPGQNKSTGLEIQGCITKSGAGANLCLTIKNSSPNPLAGDKFAIQLNKNAIGFYAVKQLAQVMPSIVPSGGSCDVEVPLMAGKPELLVSEVPPSAQHTLQLQVAIKCQLDIFYFTQPFDARAILESGKDWVDRQRFMAQWQATESRQAQRVYLYGPGKALDANDLLTKLLDDIGFFFVAKNNSNNCSYYAGRYSHQGTGSDSGFHYALLECCMQNQMIRINARSTQQGMPPVLHTTCVNALGIKPKQ